MPQPGIEPTVELLHFLPMRIKFNIFIFGLQPKLKIGRSEAEAESSPLGIKMHRTKTCCDMKN